MNPSDPQIDIDAIVAAVIRRLGQTAVQPHHQAPGGRRRPAGPTAASTRAPIARLECRVLSLEQLRGIDPNAEEIEVAPSCVVTPAAVDAIRDRKQRLVRRAHRMAHPCRAGAILLMCERDAVVDLPGPTERLVASEDIAADARRITAHINGGGHLAVWWTTRPFAAAERLAGQRGVRLAQLAAVDDWKRADREVQPNVLVLDRARWPSREVVRLFQTCVIDLPRTDR